MLVYKPGQASGERLEASWKQLGRIREASGGIWEVSVRHLEASHLGGIWGQLGHLWRSLEASGSIWDTSEGIWKHLRKSGDIWETSGGTWKTSRGIWETPGGMWKAGRHLGGIWETSTVGFSPSQVDVGTLLG